MGTLAYIAPERLAGESVGEPAADVYSLAVTAFEALTGRPPHRAETPAELLEKVRHGPPPDVTEAWLEVPPPLRSVLAHGLDPDPDRRQASAGAMVRDLEAALERPSGEPHVFQPTQPMPTVPPREEPASRPFVPPPVAEHRRRRWLLPALAVLAAMFAAGVWVALSAGGSDGGNRNGSGQADNGRGAKQTSTASGAATPTASNSSDATETGTLGAGPSTPAAQPTGSSPEVGAQLNEQGYELIQQGRYAEAVPVLRRAVASFPRETADINYAYALFNLGHALRMAGRPEKAIPILEQRLQIPDQTQTVQAELGAARAEAGE
jgi:serine/threonine-protein kinase